MHLVELQDVMHASASQRSSHGGGCGGVQLLKEK
jgi:hypothetical protein